MVKLKDIELESDELQWIKSQIEELKPIKINYVFYDGKNTFDFII